LQALFVIHLVYELTLIFPLYIQSHLILLWYTSGKWYFGRSYSN